MATMAEDKEKKPRPKYARDMMHANALPDYAAIALVPVAGKEKLVQICGIIVRGGKVVHQRPLFEAEDIPWAVSRAGVEAENAGCRMQERGWPPDITRAFDDDDVWGGEDA